MKAGRDVGLNVDGKDPASMLQDILYALEKPAANAVP